MKKEFQIISELIQKNKRVIQMLCQLFLKPGDQVVVPEYSFLMYRIYSSIVGAKVVFSKEKEFKISVDEIIKKS